MTTIAPPTPRSIPRPRPMPVATPDRAPDVPVVAAFILSAAGWLVLGSVLALLASIKLHMPDFFATAEWLTFGRVRPAHVCLTLYGWASMAGIGALLWLATVPTGARLPCPRVLLGSCVLWNAAVAAATLALLSGAGTATSWPNLPALWAIVCCGVLVLMMGVVLMLFARQRPRALRVAQWYILAAVVGFSFVYLAATTLVQTQVARGVVRAILTAWFDQQVINLWLTAIGLAALYYLIPTLAGRPLYSRTLAAFGFWTFVLIAPWSGPQRLAGGPVPAWIVTVGMVATVALLIPVAAVAINLHKTLRGGWCELRRSVALRFVVVGGMAYTVAAIQEAVQALPPVDAVTHFTQCSVAQTHLMLYGFVTMVLFGAAYHILPRLHPGTAVPRQWAEVHFWCATSGLAVYWLGLLAAGCVQGLAAQDAGTPITEVLVRLTPFLGARSVAGYLMLTGHIAFAGWAVQVLWPRTMPLAQPEGAA